ncbi:TIGR04219 family outer membrane beta-barrel protein [Shewanella sp. 10N.286.51.B8]|uniref:TIGR04219 family outer membrane beta-barrel protein n=1 Tax=unclassified Shewanella TaxID=196818 RepID=UPI0026E194AA|nr:TIGR04219 family outer membrane beta-barrel protein [Shewanella sp. 6_MG-2023]MDO6619339.1 TIGR04219 family outer membrane beta-barrel protein [Shewanella sp. 6_MG-2023]
MKKTLLATSLLGLLSISSAQAATVLGFKVGGDYWQADTSGSFNSDDGVGQTYNYDSDAQGSVWIAFEHPIPLVPNVKIRENRLEGKGKQTDSNFFFNDISIDGASTAYNDLSNTDFVFYYEILDNDLVALDLGAAYKQMHGSIRINGTTDAGSAISSEVDVDSGIVMLYGSAEVGVPGLGLYAFADVMLGIDESNVYDYNAGLGWKFDGVALDTAIRVGYREFKFDVDDFSRTTQNMSFKGAFAGVELTF